jgi:DNA-binding transcriptional LysR family regulator
MKNTSRSAGGLTGWDAARVFLEVVRCGSSRSAAERLGLSITWFAVTEGLGTFWLAPRLVEFQQAFPNILVDLHCAMHCADVLRHEADVAIHLSKPAALDVKLVRLGRMHVMSFASQKYIETFGAEDL